MTAVLTLRRTDLVAARACAEWLAVFDEICALRGDERAPLVRRGGVSLRDPERLRVALTPLAQLWMARDARGAVTWLREQGVLGPVFAPRLRAEGIDLRGADLRGANLRGADLRGAYLSSADLSSADLCGANLDDTKIKGTNAIIQIGPIGSRADMMLVFNTDDGLRVSTGCFYGSADDFLVRVMETHGTNQHATNYRNALELAASMLK